MKLNFISILATVLLSSTVKAQLSGTVGPTTTRAAKAAVKVCNVLDYGGVASKTSDIGPPLASAWAACKSGGEGKAQSILSMALADDIKSTSQLETMEWQHGLH